MEHKIINTGDYLIIVDESDIKEGDWAADFRLDGRILVSKWNEEDYEDGFFFDTKKIISHLPLNNSPILEGVILLPPLEDEAEKLAEKEIPYSSSTTLNVQRMRFIHGYNKAREKYKYTEEDIKKAFRAGFIQRNEAKPNSCDNLIQSLQQPKMPIGFKCEIELCEESCKHNWCKHRGCQNPIRGDSIKTTTNSQGLTQLVGEYIY